MDAHPPLPPHPRLAVLDAAKEPLTLLPLQARGARVVILILLHLRGPVHDVVDVDGGEGWHHLCTGGGLSGGQVGRLKGRKRQQNTFWTPAPTQVVIDQIIMGAGQWRGRTDHAQALHLGVNHPVCVLGEWQLPAWL